MQLHTFYADRARRESAERDLGLAWRSADGTTYRAAWIEDTEEVYAVAHMTEDGHGGDVELLGTLGADELATVLAGWEDVCGLARSYEWLSARVHEAVATRPRRAARPRRRGARRAVADLLVPRSRPTALGG